MSLSTTAPASRERIVAEARGWIGTPYRHQASLKGIGCDCLGLVRGVFRAVVGREPEAPPPYTPDWAEATGCDTLLDAAIRHLIRIDAEASASGAFALGAFAPGDVLLFRWRAGLPAKHAAIVTSDDTMVHAHDGARVAEVAIAPWWRRRIAGVFAFPGVSD
ncbi:MAG: C40 family peptidase [Rhodoplanes sp.]|uniref:NlpC/P60 family protein n=1 Tax=Rhodoplanes sp. TaxID=1968906 RepID=UPI0018110B6A|nr:NlpC/P60 family protein [Rhodoplanes sp.]NVO15454.1 C40 family peptidase [Rhodoplanes sp.]